MPSYDYIQSISRAADILELVGNSPNGLSLVQIAQTRRLHRQTAFNILRTLVHKGLLLRESSPPRYLLGPVMAGLRMRQEKLNQDLVRRAMPVVLRVARETGAEVILSHYTGGEVVGRIRIPTVPDEQPIVRYTWRMHPYGTGLVFQACMSPMQLDDYRRRNPLEAYDQDGFWKSYELLDGLIARLRGGGCLAYLKSNILRVVVPIFGVRGALSAAMSLIKNPVADISACGAKRCVGTAVEAADELSACLKSWPARPASFDEWMEPVP